MGRIFKHIILDAGIPQVAADTIWLRYDAEKNRFGVYVSQGNQWKNIGGLSSSGGGGDEDEGYKEIYYGTTPPEDLTKLWVDTEDGSDKQDIEYYGELQEVREYVRILTANMRKLEKLVTMGIIPGDSTTSGRTEITQEYDEAEKPEEIEGDDSAVEPDVSDVTKTTTCIKAKIDTKANFKKNQQNLTDGEILFFSNTHELAVYYPDASGKPCFWVAGTSGGGGGGGDFSLDELYASQLEYLRYKDSHNQQYIQTIDDYGRVRVIPNSEDYVGIGNPVDGVYVSNRFGLNAVFCGGYLGNSGALVSHNFVELANSSNNDINLNGILLLYTDGSKASAGDVGYLWKVLPLKGIIRAHETFLIRGARCNSDKASFIKVDHCDMEWYDGDALIQFSQTSSSFYLAVGDNDEQDPWVYDNNKVRIEKNALGNPWHYTAQDPNANYGYIDACGFGAGSLSEGNGASLLCTIDWNKAMFVRWFSFEVASQGNKAYNVRKTSDLWTFINLEKHNTYKGNSVQYYYPDWMKVAYGPKASGQHKDFFTNKTVFDDKKPNMVSVLFGIQATSDSANNVQASRCFNWISVGYYDEYLEYRKQGTTTWTRVYSISEDDASQPSRITQFIQFYKRYRWPSANGTWQTTHKVILHKCLTSGVWEYRIGRKNDNSYTSDIYTFRVWDASEVSNFKFVQVTDQQGFNWAEYQAWKKTSDCIMATESGLAFSINTGDMTQSGNRENEWLDYFDGREAMRNLEEMVTIGNNDLCGADATVMGPGGADNSKFNHINVLRYYTFELDPENEYTFEWGGAEYPMYSLYSFNFGAFHFVCLNSETSRASNMSYGFPALDADFARTFNASMETWLDNDLKKWKGVDVSPTNCSDVIVYMHEMPFTMSTYGFFTQTRGATRGGSQLNTLNNNGNYRYSRLFLQYGIRLVLGGHKHTYVISKPMYDAPADYIDETTHTPVSGASLMGTVSAEASRKPVVQILRNQDAVEAVDGFGDPTIRYELVDTITAPTYVMSQASGYKLVSNKELPSSNLFTIPWLFSYFKAKTSTAESSTEDVIQHYPMYIVYELNSSRIKITAKQVDNVWNVNRDTNKKNYDMNNQLVNISSRAMTLSQITEADRAAYSITDVDSYTITL